MDMIKVRIQLKSEAKASSLSPFSIAREIYSKEGGVKAFYRGYAKILTHKNLESTQHFSDKQSTLLSDLESIST